LIFKGVTLIEQNDINEIPNIYLEIKNEHHNYHSFLDTYEKIMGRNIIEVKNNSTP
jgi:hypothetical protein